MIDGNMYPVRISNGMVQFIPRGGGRNRLKRKLKELKLFNSCDSREDVVSIENVRDIFFVVIDTMKAAGVNIHNHHLNNNNNNNKQV